MSLFARNVADHAEMLVRLSEVDFEVERAGQVLRTCIEGGGKVMLCGNGGSAADAQHFAAELTGRLVKERKPLAALALTTDTSALTCIGNDYGYEFVFERQVKALAKRNDVLIAISTSGNSENVCRAASAARECGALVVGLTGCDGGALKDLCDVAIIVPSRVTARIQEAHVLIGHTLCECAEG